MQVSTYLANIYDPVRKHVGGGTLPEKYLQCVNDKAGIDYIQGGIEIFQRAAKHVENAESEVCIQTTIWDNSLPVKLFNEALLKAANNCRGGPIKVYLLIDMPTGPLAAITPGRKHSHQDTDPKNLGLEEHKNLEFHIQFYQHTTLRRTALTSIIVDNKSFILSNLGFEASVASSPGYFGDAWILQGNAALVAKTDFNYLWFNQKHPDYFAAELPSETATNPVTLLFTTSKARKFARLTDTDTPVNNGLIELIRKAQVSIKMATPLLNLPGVIQELASFINKRHGQVELLLGKSFCARNKSIALFGGDNAKNLSELIKKIKGKESQLNARWFSRDGRNPIEGDVPGANLMNLMLVDKRVTLGGTGYPDVIGCRHWHCMNIVIEDEEIALKLSALFDGLFNQSIPAQVDHSLLTKIGLKGFREAIGTTQDLRLEAITITQSKKWVSISFAKPEGFSYYPGQYLSVHPFKNDGNFLGIPLAIASGINDTRIMLTFQSNAFMDQLNVDVGAVIKSEGPLGTYFPIDQLNYETPVLLISGGSGITPMRSVWKSLPDDVNYLVYHSAREQEDLFYYNELDALARNGHYISLTGEVKQEPFLPDRLTHYLKESEVPKHAYAFLCGPEGLIKASVKILLEKGLKEDHIYVSLLKTAKQEGPVFPAHHPAVQRLLK